MRISDWSSDVCSSDLAAVFAHLARPLLERARIHLREGTPMPNDTLFGVHAAALEVRSKRMGLLASNISNVSTPGFKATDIDFHTAPSAGEKTVSPASPDGPLQYLVPLQPSADGTTHDRLPNATAFAENAGQERTAVSRRDGRLARTPRAGRDWR